MSKQDNLKDYLADLYQGIASKKPGASKNPQDFRREIESIVTGSINVENVSPITVKQNGTYTYTYETATETFDTDTQWELYPDEDQTWLGVKKATNFIVPKTEADALSRSFCMSFTLEDGTTNTLYFDELVDESMVSREEWGYMVAMSMMFVLDATSLNAELDEPYFENNTFYLTNAIWAYFAVAGLDLTEMPSVSITFASKLIENSSFYPVTVDVQPKLIEKTVHSNGVYKDSVADGFSKVTVDVPAKITVYGELPTENLDSRHVYEKDGVLYKLNIDALIGGWILSSAPDPSYLHNLGISQIDVRFTCNGVDYSRMGISYDNWDYQLYYDNTEVYGTQALTSWLDESYRNVEFKEENAEVLAWLNLNNSIKTSGEWVEYSPGEPTYTVQGVYTIKDEDLANGCKYFESEHTFHVNFTSNGTVFHTIKVGTKGHYGGNNMTFIYDNIENNGVDSSLTVYFKDGDWDPNWDHGEEYKTIDFGSTPQVVSKEFHELLTDLTTYYIINITNNSEAIDVSSYKTAVVRVPNDPLPISVPDEDTMSVICPLSPVGSIFEYTGTTGTYENGALYIVEEVSE